MAFLPGDYVYPADLPRRLLCRVAAAESGRTRTGAFQILTLEPLEKPWSDWPRPNLIVRFDESVRPAPAHDLWRSAGSGPEGESPGRLPGAAFHGSLESWHDVLR